MYKCKCGKILSRHSKSGKCNSCVHIKHGFYTKIHKCIKCGTKVSNNIGIKLCFSCLLKQRTLNRKGTYFQCFACKKVTYNRPSVYNKQVHHFCSKKCAKLFLNQFRNEGKLKKIIQDYLKYKKFADKINSNEICWFTGFWEGEGNIRILNTMSSVFSISQKDRTPLDFIFQILKIGKICKYKHNIYTYTIGKSGYILALIERMKPFLHSQKRIKEVNNLIEGLKCLKK
jgi:endogenous inhibitor of DNA gyrase (YacG/DUF329 family)